MLPFWLILTGVVACYAALTRSITDIVFDIKELSATASPLNKQLMSLSIE